MTTETTSRYNAGGFEDRFRVTRTDGKAVRESARYIVLNYAEDPHAAVALRAYADSIKDENPQMATDILAALVNPTEFPAQHD